MSGLNNLLVGNTVLPPFSAMFAKTKLSQL